MNRIDLINKNMPSIFHSRASDHAFDAFLSGLPNLLYGKWKLLTRVLLDFVCEFEEQENRWFWKKEINKCKKKLRNEDFGGSFFFIIQNCCEFDNYKSHINESRFMGQISMATNNHN